MKPHHTFDVSDLDDVDDDYDDDARVEGVDRCIDPAHCCNPHFLHDANECEFHEDDDDDDETKPRERIAVAGPPAPAGEVTIAIVGADGVVKHRVLVPIAEDESQSSIATRVADALNVARGTEPSSDEEDILW